MKKINCYSPAMLKTFEQCPLKFFKKYIQNIETLQNRDFFETGKRIHALANYFLNGEDIFLFEKELSPDEINLWTKLKANEYFSLKKIKTEYFLSIKSGENRIGGRIDALMQDKENNYYILDYKTGGIPQNYEYDYQTMIYLLCIKAYLKQEKINSLNFVYLGLKENETGKVQLTKSLEDEYKEKIKTVCSKIERFNNINQYPQTNNCKNCEYKKACKD